MHCSHAVVVRRCCIGLARDGQERCGERRIDVDDVEARRGLACGFRGVDGGGGLQAAVTQHLGDLDERGASRTMPQAAVWRSRCDPPLGCRPADRRGARWRRPCRTLPNPVPRGGRRRARRRWSAGRSRRRPARRTTVDRGLEFPLADGEGGEPGQAGRLAGNRHRRGRRKGTALAGRQPDAGTGTLPRAITCPGLTIRVGSACCRHRRARSGKDALTALLTCSPNAADSACLTVTILYWLNIIDRLIARTAAKLSPTASAEPSAPPARISRSQPRRAARRT